MMRKLAMVVVGACVLVSACGSGDKPRPAPVPVQVVTSEPQPSTPVATPDVTRETSHTSRVPDPGPTREPLSQPDNRMVPETTLPPKPRPPKPSLKPEVVKTTPPKPPPRTIAPPTSKPTPVVVTGNVITIGAWSRSYVTAYGDQGAVDKCNVVEWKAGWLVGHNHCGYAFWAFLGAGDTITLTGKDAGVYTVFGMRYLPYQGGEVWGLPPSDLILQTCKGSGTQLVFAKKTG